MLECSKNALSVQEYERERIEREISKIELKKY